MGVVRTMGLWHNRVQIGCLFLLFEICNCRQWTIVFWLVHEMTIGMLIICHDRGMNMHAHVLQSKDWCWRAAATGRTPCPNRVSALEKLITPYTDI